MLRKATAVAVGGGFGPGDHAACVGGVLLHRAGLLIGAAVGQAVERGHVGGEGAVGAFFGVVFVACHHPQVVGRAGGQAFEREADRLGAGEGFDRAFGQLGAGVQFAVIGPVLEAVVGYQAPGVDFGPQEHRIGRCFGDGRPHDHRRSR